MWLPHGRVVPVLRAPQQRADSGRHVDQVVAVRTAGLQEQDSDIRVLAQAVGEDAARRPGANDHVVVLRMSAHCLPPLAQTAAERRKCEGQRDSPIGTIRVKEYPPYVLQGRDSGRPRPPDPSWWWRWPTAAGVIGSRGAGAGLRMDR